MVAECDKYIELSEALELNSLYQSMYKIISRFNNNV